VGSLYLKRGRLWARFKNASGKWAATPTPYLPADRDKALRFLKVLEADTRIAVSESPPKRPGTPTVSEYSEGWIKDRRALGLRTADDDETRLKLHALPAIGAMAIDEVRPRHIRDLVLALRKDGALAPRSIRNVYGVLATMFRTAVADEVIAATPCVLARGILPKKVDKDPAWRATAIFTRPEVEQLISDVRIPEDRRVLYGLKGIAGLRHTEAATLRWRQYDAALEPLGALNLERTKTGVPRRIPVHPTLARLLAEWKLSGWERTYGRRPEPDDVIVPTRNLTERPSPDAQRSLGLDLDTLKLRRRRGHDLRRTFVTLAQVDGARRDLLETISHGPRGDIINVYSSFPWPALCAEVAKLKIEVREGQVIEADFATRFATTQESARRRWRKSATPAGFEIEPAFFSKPSGTRPWPVTPQDVDGTDRQLVSSRGGSGRLEMQSHGTLTALRIRCDVDGPQRSRRMALAPQRLPGSNRRRPAWEGRLRDNRRSQRFASSRKDLRDFVEATVMSSPRR
jgi:integrase